MHKILQLLLAEDYNIYAIYDKVAEDTRGGLILQRHDAAAIRIFRDIYGEQGSMVNMHPDDYDLVALAFQQTNEIPEIVVAVRTVLTGSQLAAAQLPSPRPE